MTVQSIIASEKSIVLFDGVCNLCNEAVNFVMRRDPDKNFVFASLQSGIAQELLQYFSKDSKSFDSVVLIKNNQLYKKSRAALEMTRQLKGAWFLLYIFVIVPPFIRNFVYDIVARYRYKWFGRKEVCPMPTPEERERFLEM